MTKRPNIVFILTDQQRIDTIAANGFDHMVTPNLPFYLDNWDKAIHARGAKKPSRVTYAKRPDYDDALGAYVWEQDEDLHPDIFVGDTACWWLERYPGTEPFFLQVGLPGPRPPDDPTQEYLDMYRDKDLPEAILTDTDFMTMIRWDKWKLVHFVDCEDGQLFDLEADPGERVNLWNDPDHAAIHHGLIDHILKWRIESARKTQDFVQMLATQTQ